MCLLLCTPENVLYDLPELIEYPDLAPVPEPAKQRSSLELNKAEAFLSRFDCCSIFDSPLDKFYLHSNKRPR